MPSEKTLNAKKELVAALKTRIEESSAGVIVDYKGISVDKDTVLRKQLREAGVEYDVVKNSMLTLAVKGTELESLTEHLKESTALATIKGEMVDVAKILDKYADDSKGAFKIKAGYMDGKPVDSASVSAIAKLPGKEQLLAMLCGALNGNVRNLAYALSKVAEQKESA